MLREWKHPEYFLPEAVPGFCSLTCCMGVLNYFWSTSFNGQNTWQMMNLFKEGLYTGKEMLDLPEIACKLDQLWFNIDYYLSYSEELHKDSVVNPMKYLYDRNPPRYHQFIKYDEQGYYWDSGSSIQRLWDTKFEQKILQSETIKSYYSADILQVIKDHQGAWILFLVGLDYYTLHNEPMEEGFAWGHVILVSKIEDDHVIIFDPGPPLLLYHKVPIDQFMRSVEEMGTYYSFMKITDKHADLAAFFPVSSTP